jgi:hypothetical protein
MSLDQGFQMVFSVNNHPSPVTAQLWLGCNWNQMPLYDRDYTLRDF